MNPSINKQQTSSKLTALEVALVERVVPAVYGPGYGGHLAGHVAKEPAGVLGACAQAVGGEVELEFGKKGLMFKLLLFMALLYCNSIDGTIVVLNDNCNACDLLAVL